MNPIPILLNHDHTKAIGVWKPGGIGVFNADQRITRDMLFNIFGGAGVRFLDMFEEDGEIFVRAFEILEFSLTTAHQEEASRG